MKNGIILSIMLGAIMVIAMQNTMAINSQDPTLSVGLADLYHLNNDSYYGEYFNVGAYGMVWNFVNASHNLSKEYEPVLKTSDYCAFGKCYSFDGVSARFTSEADNGFNYNPGNTGFAISVWFKPVTYQAGDTAYGYFYGQGQGCGYSFGMGQSEWYSPLTCTLVNVTTATGTATHVNIHTNAWNHGVCTYNATEVNATMGRMHLYLNGVEVGNATATNRTVGYPSWCSNNTRIARSGGFYFNGSIDEVAMWTRPLNTTEVSYLYNERKCNLKSYVDGGIDSTATSVNNTLGCIYSREQYGVSNVNMTNNVTFNGTGTTRLWGFQFWKGVHTNKFKLSPNGHIRIKPQAIVNGTLLNGGFRLK